MIRNDFFDNEHLWIFDCHGDVSSVSLPPTSEKENYWRFEGRDRDFACVGTVKWMILQGRVQHFEALKQI